MVTGRRAAMHTGGAEILAKAAARRERQGDRYNVCEEAITAEMLVVGMLRIEGEEGDLVPAGELFEDIVAANLAAHVGGEQASGFDP